MTDCGDHIGAQQEEPVSGQRAANETRPVLAMVPTRPVLALVPPLAGVPCGDRGLCW